MANDSSTSGKGDIRICFIGDSFVVGTGDESARGWVGRVCADAISSGHNLTGYNLGVRRNTSFDILQRWKSEAAARLPQGCDNRLVFSFGVNDTKLEGGAPRLDHDASVRNLGQILQDAASCRILLVGPPPVDDPEQNRRIEVLSLAFGDAARKAGAGYIDLYAPLSANTDYMKEIAAGDGAHPEAGGYAAMARVILKSHEWWFGANGRD